MSAKYEATVKSLSELLKLGNIEEVKGDIVYSDGSTFKKSYQKFCGKGLEFTKIGNMYKYGNVTIPATWLKNIKLLESDIWENMVIDTLIQVSLTGEEDSYGLAYFESYDTFNGKVTAFDNGRTSKTQAGKTEYGFYRKI